MTPEIAVPDGATVSARWHSVLGRDAVDAGPPESPHDEGND